MLCRAVVPNLFVPTGTFESLWDSGGHQPINLAHFSFFWTKKYVETK
jgi:hypothetical protein